MGEEGQPRLRILTVCLGNVCRSPLMERLLRSRLPDDVVVESAGLVASPGAVMDELAAGELARLGGSADGFTARPFQPEYAASADLVLTATAEVKSGVLRECPAALRRTFTLLELACLLELAPDGTAKELIAWAAANRSRAAGHDVDVVDPIGRSQAVHREAADAIDTATKAVASALAT
jgi:protein-tyrosine phosphatase